MIRGLFQRLKQAESQGPRGVDELGTVGVAVDNDAGSGVEQATPVAGGREETVVLLPGFGVDLDGEVAGQNGIDEPADMALIPLLLLNSGRVMPGVVADLVGVAYDVPLKVSTT